MKACSIDDTKSLPDSMGSVSTPTYWLSCGWGMSHIPMNPAKHSSTSDLVQLLSSSERTTQAKKDSQ